VPPGLAELGVFEALLDVSPVGGYAQRRLLGVDFPAKRVIVIGGYFG
jgi:hypothetical protein